MSRRPRPEQGRIRDRRILASFVAVHAVRLGRAMRLLEVYELHVARGLSIRATARVLGIAHVTARNHVTRLRRQALTWHRAQLLPERRTA